MIRRILFFSLLVGLVLACNNSATDTAQTDSETDIKSLKKEVIALHDTSMARMNLIGSLQKKLQQEMTDEDSASFTVAYSDLQEAREGMMNWMREFEVPSESTEEQQMAYLKDENDRIRKVDDVMLEAIEKAEKLLEDKALN